MLTEILSRIQFGFTISFHIIFPTISIGLALFLSIMEGAWLVTENPVYYKICRFWVKIFALTFGLGIVSGIVMEYELGTNFAQFTNAVGGVLGPLFSYEVLSAFFLEAGFLGVMLFGWNRVGKGLHFAATLLVTVGAIFSAFWILSANSWMQTPAGYHLVANKFIVSSWWQAIFNPSFVPRFIHMVLASFVTASFVITGISAWYLVRKRDLDIAKPVFSFGIIAAAILVPLQIFVGDMVGLEVLQNQPLKTAAMEANWQTQAGAPFVVFAWPDQAKARNLYAITIPNGASLINTHQLDGVLPGLNMTSPKNWPPVAAVFFSFRVMLAIGAIFLVMAWYGVWLIFRRRLFESRRFQWLCMWLPPLGLFATLSGWYTAEFGRQPWIVYNLMRTVDGISLVPPLHVMISLSALVTIYGIIFGFYLYYLFKLIRNGPADVSPPAIISYMPYPKTRELEHDR